MNDNARLHDILTRIGFTLVAGTVDDHFQTWVIADEDVTVHRNGIWVQVETSTMQAKTLCSVMASPLEGQLRKTISEL